MNFYDAWIKALKNTEIVRPRIRSLNPSADTDMPYLFLAESSVNPGDTVVRKGEVSIQKPQLVLPPNSPQFEGFDWDDFDGQEASVINFLLVRGISMPSYRYNNQTSSLDVYEGRLPQAMEHFKRELRRKEDVRTGLLVGLEDIWQMSVLIYNCTQVVKNAEDDIRRLLKEFRDRDS
ncbi:MAG: hypothetical protein ACLFPX_07050 [Candidatus Omnitrophota bacterium]